MAEAARGFGDVVLPSSGGVGNRAASMEKTVQNEKIFRIHSHQINFFWKPEMQKEEEEEICLTQPS